MDAPELKILSDTPARRPGADAAPPSAPAPDAAAATREIAPSDRHFLDVRREILAQNGQPGILMNLILAIAVGATLYRSAVPTLWVSAWLLAMLAAMTVRAAFVRHVSRADAVDWTAAVRLGIGSGVLIGLVWGACGLFLFYGLGNAQVLVITLSVVCVMVASATNGAKIGVFVAFLVPAFTPLILYVLIHPSYGIAAVAVVMVVLGIALLRAANNATVIFRRSAALVASVEDASKRLHDNERLFRVIADYSHDWELWFDSDGTVIWTSPSVERFTGYRPEDARADPDAVFVGALHPDDRDRVLRAVAKGTEMRSRGEVEFRLVHRDGSVRWCESVSNPVYDETGAFDGFRASVRDISVQKRLEADLEQLASLDSLTGVLNRRCFVEKATEEIYRAGRYDKPLTVAMLDLDRFKKINDTHGHVTGDRCLVALADIVRKSIRQSDLFARFGGEEFILLLPETELPYAMQLCERLRRRVELSPVETDKGPVAMTVSIGVADFQQNATTLDSLVARADAALYTAKRDGRNQVAYGPADLAPVVQDGRSAETRQH